MKSRSTGRIRVLFAGRARAPFLDEGMEQFLPRLRRYRTEIVSNPKPGSAREELAFFQRQLKATRRVIALDPGGRPVDTHEFARLLSSSSKLDLLIGGVETFSLWAVWFIGRVNNGNGRKGVQRIR